MINSLSTLALVAILCSLSSPNFPSRFTAMNSQSLVSQNLQSLPVSLEVTLLEAYEAKVPPPGSKGPHPVGHAVVRLHMENLTQQPVQFTVENIRITSTRTQNPLMQQAGGSVQLGGLQIKESGFHLTNQQGFIGHQEICAMVTYRYHGRTFTVISSPLKIAISPS